VAGFLFRGLQKRNYTKFARKNLPFPQKNFYTGFMNLSAIGPQLQAFFSVNSYGSILLRASIWFLVAIVIIATTDASNRHMTGRQVQQNLGMLFLFLILCGGLVYLLFGFVPIA
jgi:hypothetical protein